ncbi:MAG TPA: hypothetical protein VE685_07325 [Thermoanaerobaculia bacterium]|nr:hypothetical protein [Thermoanaerobaculia bacterium]
MADEPQNPAQSGDAAEAAADAHLKSVAAQPAILANLSLSNLIQNINLAQQNAVSNQQAMNQLSVAIVGKTVNLLTTLGPEEARSAEQVLTGNSVVEEIADLKAAVAAAPAAEPTEAKKTTTSATGPASGGTTLESLSGDALATAFAVLNAILGGGQKRDDRDKPRE